MGPGTPAAGRGPAAGRTGWARSGVLGLTLALFGLAAGQSSGAGPSGPRADARHQRAVDAFVQQGAKLTGTGTTPSSHFGWSVALSADGNTAVVGSYPDAGRNGAARIFTRSGGKWKERVKLVGEGATVKGSFGESVALSADGRTAFVGSYLDNNGKGAAWVFARTGGAWKQQGRKLTGRGEIGNARFGISVALSSNGSTALIGGYNDDIDRGAAWVFTRSARVWKQQGGKLTGKGEVGNGQFGESVALSSGGSIALIGGRLDNGGKGAAWVFTRSRSKWKQQGGKLTGSGEKGSGRFGHSVALSARGSTALIGGYRDNGRRGAAWVFTRAGTTWKQQGGKLTGGGAGGDASFGYSVELSATGALALIGGYSDSGSKGAAWVFTRSGTAWNQQGAKLTGAGESGSARFGIGVAVSADGKTFLVGGSSDAGGVGAAWPFRSAAK